MVNEHSTVSELQRYIENARFSTRVGSYVNHDDRVVFEAHAGNPGDADEVTVPQVKQQIDMLVTTYGADIERKTMPRGEDYFRIECSMDGIINDQ